MSLRSKRLGSPLDAAASDFLDSTREDEALVREDILGSLAHVSVLEKAKILSKQEAEALRQALAMMHATSGRFLLKREFEDVHMNVEAVLTERLGDLGKKLHTARSRNDQVALDLRLWARRSCLDLARAVHGLAQAQLELGQAHPEAIVPGHTHFQVAQPLLLSHQLSAHAARLERDLDRLEDAFARINVSPLGAGAIAGTRHAVDPALAAQLLGFSRAFDNGVDATSDRDFVHELLFAATLALTHASAWAEEVITFSHPAFGFYTLGDAHATGSSLMPQKKNPDVFEVARARASTLLGALTATLGQAKGLPLAYNRDYQETKRVFLETLPLAIATVNVVADATRGLQVHPAKMAAVAELGYSDATEVADFLVEQGVPFREAHEVAAETVRRALELGVSLSGLSPAELKRLHPKLGKGLDARLGVRATVAAKTSPGGTAPASAKAAEKAIHERLASRLDFIQRTERTLEAVSQSLLSTKVVKNR